MQIDVALSPSEIGHINLRGNTVVVIDVLRASSTIIAAVENGCERVIPVRDERDAFTTAKACSKTQPLLCGERNGVKIKGFDLGNSPREYLPQVVKNRTLILTTTNGTQLFQYAAAAAKVFIGALVNAQALASLLLHEKRNIVILCAGKEGRFSLEDCYCAGIICHKIRSMCGNDILISNTAQMSEIIYNSYDSKTLEMLKYSEHGQYLTSIGFDKDLDACAATDSSATIPVWEEGSIRAI